MQPKDILDKAADELARRGWTTGNYVRATGEVCLLGAIAAALVEELEPLTSMFVIEDLKPQASLPVPRSRASGSARRLLAAEIKEELDPRLDPDPEGVIDPEATIAFWNDSVCVDAFAAEQMLRRASKRESE
jgi:hypothetical protein